MICAVLIFGFVQHNGLQTGGVNVVGEAYLAVILLVVFFPLLLRRRGQAPGESDADSEGGGGGGGGPRKPPTPPNPSGPGLPLDDAEPALARLRAPGRISDHGHAPARRPSHRPKRRRERTPSGS